MTKPSASLGLILTALLVLASCSSKAASTPTAGNASPASPPSSATIGDPLDGTAWRSTFTCDDEKKSLVKAGLQKYVSKVLAGCEGVQHGYIAFSDGLLTWGPSGEKIPYQIVNGHTFVEDYESYSFRIHGNKAFFEGHVVAALYPYSTAEMRGEEAVDVAQRGFPYERVG